LRFVTLSRGVSNENNLASSIGFRREHSIVDSGGELV